MPSKENRGLTWGSRDLRCVRHRPLCFCSCRVPHALWSLRHSCVLHQVGRAPTSHNNLRIRRLPRSGQVQGGVGLAVWIAQLDGPGSSPGSIAYQLGDVEHLLSPRYPFCKRE